jgi:hypothetical protein
VANDTIIWSMVDELFYFGFSKRLLCIVHCDNNIVVYRIQHTIKHALPTTSGYIECLIIHSFIVLLQIYVNFCFDFFWFQDIFTWYDMH